MDMYQVFFMKKAEMILSKLYDEEEKNEKLMVIRKYFDRAGSISTAGINEKILRFEVPFYDGCVALKSIKTHKRKKEADLLTFARNFGSCFTAIACLFYSGKITGDENSVLSEVVRFSYNEKDKEDWSDVQW